ncbi:MAG: hypothetical protein ACOYZ7_01190 [Chloroflexota bacterium]
MALEVWYRTDIENAILAAEQAATLTLDVTGASGERAEGYRAGYLAALTTVALAFGLRPAKAQGVSCGRLPLAL